MAFVIAVALTPRDAWWLLCAEAAVALVAMTFTGLGLRRAAPRMLVAVPFVAFALLLPFVGVGERVVVGPFTLSSVGLWSAWAVLAKSTLSLCAVISVTATTTVPDLLLGLARLRVPSVFVSIAGFMVRYLDVLIGEAQRMRIAMAARGFRARNPREMRPVASGAATLFIRAHERGERIHGAMLARGYREVTP